MMADTFKVGVLVGSLRKGSYSRQLAHNLVNLAPRNLSFTFIEIGDLPFYNEDLETNAPPAPWVRFRNEVRGVDAILFVTPEYNRSVPGVLKNAIDVGSRPYGQSVWDNKPAGVVSSSTGGIGGFGSNHHLRQSLVFLNMPTLQQPEAYVGAVDKSLGPDGKVNNPNTTAFLENIIKAFGAWIERVQP